MGSATLQTARKLIKRTLHYLYNVLETGWQLMIRYREKLMYFNANRIYRLVSCQLVF